MPLVRALSHLPRLEVRPGTPVPLPVKKDEPMSLKYRLEALVAALHAEDPVLAELVYLAEARFTALAREYEELPSDAKMRVHFTQQDCAA
jgi:hypothetical protein